MFLNQNIKGGFRIVFTEILYKWENNRLTFILIQIVQHSFLSKIFSFEKVYSQYAHEYLLT